ncbi:histidine phosphatase family protein [Ferrimonas sp.]|uniref:histidine phosphatase family protein n=1 Tax=Ferrimonas sp. TaxID=2080861 RepID=UPI003A8ECE4E
MTQFYLIRHGETLWNRQRRLQGSQNSPLTDEGVAQAEALSRELASLQFDAIYASPLERARITAEIINQPHGLPLQLEEGLKERAFGVLEGCHREEQVELWQALSLRFSQNTVDVPGFEPAEQLQSRALEALQRIHLAQPQGRVAIVSHGEWLRSVGNAHGGHPAWSDNTPLQANASFITLDWPLR